MFVNAVEFPGPALWQGIMLIIAPLFLWGALRKDGKYIGRAMTAYGCFGAALMAFIILR